MASKLKNLTLLVLVLFTVTSVSGSNVLFYPALGHGSHYFVFKRISKELVTRGHNVTFLVDNRFEESVKADGVNEGFNVEIFQSPITYYELKELLENVTSASLKGKYIEFLMEMQKTNFTRKQIDECSNMLGDERLESRIKESKFDLALTDPSSLCPFVQYVKLPYVIISPAEFQTSIMSLENRIPFNPSYMPECTTALDHRMTFTERLKNTAYSVFFSWVLVAMGNPYQEVIEKYNLGGSTFQVLLTGAEMWLTNIDFVLNFPKAVPPNMALVGGLTTRPKDTLSTVSFHIHNVAFLLLCFVLFLFLFLFFSAWVCLVGVCYHLVSIFTLFCTPFLCDRCN